MISFKMNCFHFFKKFIIYFESNDHHSFALIFNLEIIWFYFFLHIIIIYFSSLFDLEVSINLIILFHHRLFDSLYYIELPHRFFLLQSLYKFNFYLFLYLFILFMNLLIYYYLKFYSIYQYLLLSCFL
jgi:hypothetical protein